MAWAGAALRAIARQWILKFDFDILPLEAVIDLGLAPIIRIFFEVLNPTFHKPAWRLARRVLEIHRMTIIREWNSWWLEFQTLAFIEPELGLRCIFDFAKVKKFPLGNFWLGRAAGNNLARIQIWDHDHHWPRLTQHVGVAVAEIFQWDFFWFFVWVVPVFDIEIT